MMGFTLRLGGKDDTKNHTNKQQQREALKNDRSYDYSMAGKGEDFTFD